MAKWNEFIEKTASFVKSSRMTAGGIDETPPRNWYDRRVYDASTGHQNPIRAVNDEMYRDWQRREAEKKQRWEETKKKLSGAFRQFSDTLSRTSPEIGGGYEHTLVQNGITPSSVGRNVLESGMLNPLAVPSRDMWGAIGALSGGVRGALDHGPSLSWNWINEKRKPPEGKWTDYVRAGWNAGRANADRLAAGMLSGIVPSDSVRRLEDQVYADDAGPDGTKSEYRVTDWNEKSRMKRMSELGGNATSLAASTFALGKVLPAGFRLIGKGFDRLASGAKAKKVVDLASKAVKPTLAGGVVYSGYDQIAGANEHADAASSVVDRAYEESGLSGLVDAAVKDPSGIPPAHWDFLMKGVDRLPSRVVPGVMKAYSEWQKSPRRLYAHVLDGNDKRFMDKGQINGVIRSWDKIPYENRMEFMKEMIRNRSMLDEETVSALRALTM